MSRFHQYRVTTRQSQSRRSFDTDTVSGTPHQTRLKGDSDTLPPVSQRKV